MVAFQDKKETTCWEMMRTNSIDTNLVTPKKLSLQVHRNTLTLHCLDLDLEQPQRKHPTQDTDGSQGSSAII